MKHLQKCLTEAAKTQHTIFVTPNCHKPHYTLEYAQITTITCEWPIDLLGLGNHVRGSTWFHANQVKIRHVRPLDGTKKPKGGAFGKSCNSQDLEDSQGFGTGALPPSVKCEEAPNGCNLFFIIFLSSRNVLCTLFQRNYWILFN